MSLSGSMPGVRFAALGNSEFSAWGMSLKQNLGEWDPMGADCTPSAPPTQERMPKTDAGWVALEPSPRVPITLLLTHLPRLELLAFVAPDFPP